MAHRRGFFAELQHQARVSEQQRATVQRQQEAAQRRNDKARRELERANAAVVRASAADQKRLAQEAAQAHTAVRVEEVAEMNSELAANLSELDALFSATLTVDDFVDLEALRAEVSYPPFPHPELLLPTPAPSVIREPAEPTFEEPPPVGGVFGRKKKAFEAAQAAEDRYAAQHKAWIAEVASVSARRAAQAVAVESAEANRLLRLAEEQAAFAAQCKTRADEVAAQNAQLDELISGLAYGVVEAVQEYIGIVTSNSVYPAAFPVTHSSSFDADSAELALRVSIPGPEKMPSIRGYKYVKASDEIVATPATQKEMRERYATILHSVALRSLHEVFEADRRALVKVISLEVGSEAVSTATGRMSYVPLLAVVSSREQFETIELSAVVPAATLAHLHAVVSKNPHGLVPAGTGGVRKT